MLVKVAAGHVISYDGLLCEKLQQLVRCGLMGGGDSL